MTFSEAVRSAFSQYATFKGRSRRAEFWWFILFGILVDIVTWSLDISLGTTFQETAIFGGFFDMIDSLVLLVPSLAVAARRLHDTDRTGWWLLIGLVPIVGIIVLLVFFVRDGTLGPNRFGQSQKHYVDPDLAV